MGVSAAGLRRCAFLEPELERVDEKLAGIVEAERIRVDGDGVIHGLVRLFVRSLRALDALERVLAGERSGEHSDWDACSFAAPAKRLADPRLELSSWHGSPWGLCLCGRAMWGHSPVLRGLRAQYTRISAPVKV